MNSLRWAIATRRQLERWEPYVAAALRDDGLEDADIWLAETEHHFALVAAAHLIQAVEKLAPTRGIAIDPTIRQELIEGRDLHEHWYENVPVFNVVRFHRGKRLPSEPPRPSGRDFAARNPGVSPYSWLRFRNKTGPMLLPHVSAPALHEFVDAVEADVLARDESLARFVPERAPSPWVVEDGEWWPRAVEFVSD